MTPALVEKELMTTYRNGRNENNENKDRKITLKPSKSLLPRLVFILVNSLLA